MRIPSAARRDNFDLPMTAMIDVVFNLLIFFVVAASSAVAERLLRAELPKGGSVPTAIASDAVVPAEAWNVDVWLKLELKADQFQVDMNGTSYKDVDQLKAQLRALAEVDPDNPVILDIAPDVPAGRLVDLYDTCIEAGFLKIRFATDPAKL